MKKNKLDNVKILKMAKELKEHITITDGECHCNSNGFAKVFVNNSPDNISLKNISAYEEHTSNLKLAFLNSIKNTFKSVT